MGRTRMLETTIRSITTALQQAVFSDEISQRTGFMQALDARVRVVAVAEFLISVSLARSPWIIAAIYLAALAIAWMSAIPLLHLIRRVWLAMPFFTIPLALPALFLTPGPAQIRLPPGLVITQTGIAAVVFLLLRVSSSLTLSLLLIHTTQWNAILGALARLGLPATFAFALGMTHRYVYLLLKTANDMFMSRQSRLVGRMSTDEGQRLVGAVSGSLLEKSLALSREVHLAMVSRGFHDARAASSYTRMTGRDWAVMVGSTAIAAASIWLGSVPL